MKITSLLVVLILSFKAQGESTNSQIEKTCAGQVMSLAATTQLDKSGKLKPFAYSEQVDKTFFESFKKLKAVVEGPQPELQKNNIEKIYSEVTAYAKKKTPKTFESCLKFMKTVANETQRQCSALKGDEVDFQAKMNACTEKAMSTPHVMVASEEWKQVQSKLIFK